MADTKISALTGVSAVAGANELPLNEAGTTKKASVTQLKTYLDSFRPVNFSTGSQAITANTVTYITNSGILIPASGLVAGMCFQWRIGIAKTAAGTATPIWTPRIGANQTTADGTVLTITGTAQVATLSATLVIVCATVQVASATGKIVGSVNTGAASFGIGGSTISGSFDTTGKAGQFFGLCVNSGASAAWTVNSVFGELMN